MFNNQPLVTINGEPFDDLDTVDNPEEMFAQVYNLLLVEMDTPGSVHLSTAAILGIFTMILENISKKD